MEKIGEFFIPETTEAKVNTVIINGETISSFKGKDRTIPMVNINDAWQVIPGMKSKRYNYLHHRDAANYFVENLEKSLDVFQDKPDIRYDVRFSNKFSKMIVDAIIDKPYSLNDVKPFENEYGGTFYSKNYHSREDVFKPRIRLINSFDCASKVIFGLYREICSNGMTFGKVFDKVLRFLHIDKEIIHKFRIQTEGYFDSIFENQLIEEVFENLKSKEIETDEFKEVLKKNVGKRSVGVAETVFDEQMKEKVLNQWVAYNILTFILTHYVKDVVKAQYVMDKYNRNYL